MFLKNFDIGPDLSTRLIHSGSPLSCVQAATEALCHSFIPRHAGVDSGLLNDFLSLLAGSDALFFLSPLAHKVSQDKKELGPLVVGERVELREACPSLIQKLCHDSLELYEVGPGHLKQHVALSLAEDLLGAVFLGLFYFLIAMQARKGHFLGSLVMGDCAPLIVLYGAFS